MLRFIVYFASILKLLVLGRWYPPAHVRDVSSEDYRALSDFVTEIEDRLGQVERQAEATRKKVYRDEVKAEPVSGAESVGPGVQTAPTPQDFLSGLEAGDQVPDGIL